MSNHKCDTMPIFIAWTAQFILAIVFLYSAYFKLFTSLEDASKILTWCEEEPLLFRLTGILDLLGGLGITIPTLLKIQPKLTLFSTFCIISQMLSAAIFHFSREEYFFIGVNFFIILLSGLVIWGWFKSNH